MTCRYRNKVINWLPLFEIAAGAKDFGKDPSRIQGFRT